MVLAGAAVSCRTDRPPDPPAGPVSSSAEPPAPVAATADTEVTATVDEVLAKGVHPGLTWGQIPRRRRDVEGALRR